MPHRFFCLVFLFIAATMSEEFESTRYHIEPTKLPPRLHRTTSRQSAPKHEADSAIWSHQASQRRYWTSPRRPGLAKLSLHLGVLVGNRCCRTTTPTIHQLCLGRIHSFLPLVRLSSASLSSKWSVRHFGRRTTTTWMTLPGRQTLRGPSVVVFPDLSCTSCLVLLVYSAQLFSHVLL